MEHDTTITVNNVSKSYKLYNKNTDRLFEIFNPFGKKRYTPFFALSDISFTLAKGESLGIIGENGSGKSTLLKILAGVLAPTIGDVAVTGTMGCLLELGGGFNSELSGMENARIQLVINGVKENASEVLQEIVAFADIGDFIHQPVKKYSSGMFMRLAFACATVTAPSILIVDEALAVGDIFFVKKCMNRMRQLLDSGAALLFVSHDLASVRHLCQKTLWLDRGRQMAFGPTAEVTEKYAAYIRQKSLPEENSTQGHAPSFTALELTNSIGAALHPINGAVDLTEQRLFVTGSWTWHSCLELPLHIRRTDTPQSVAAFAGHGSRLTLSFLRGGGFALPTVYIDGEKHSLEIENDNLFPELTLAPVQVRNFTYCLSAGRHVIAIISGKAPIAWLGGSCTDAPQTEVQFKDLPDWLHFLEGKSITYGDKKAVLAYVELLDALTLEPKELFMLNQSARLRIHAKRFADIEWGKLNISYKVSNRLGVIMFANSTLEEQYALNSSASSWVIDFVFPLPLKNGEYTIAAAIVSTDKGDHVVHHFIDLAASFVVQTGFQRSVWGEFHNGTQVSITEF